MCQSTDGTVNCVHRTVSEMIESARDYLDACADNASVVQDQGYFPEN